MPARFIEITPVGNRTLNLLIRSQTLYPIELRVQNLDCAKATIFRAFKHPTIAASVLTSEDIVKSSSKRFAEFKPRTQARRPVAT